MQHTLHCCPFVCNSFAVSGEQNSPGTVLSVVRVRVVPQMLRSDGFWWWLFPLLTSVPLKVSLETVFKVNLKLGVLYRVFRHLTVIDLVFPLFLTIYYLNSYCNIWFLVKRILGYGLVLWYKKKIAYSEWYLANIILL